jgi:hypothetical protein
VTTRRRKELTAEDSELWAHVTREVTPLKRRRRKPAPKPVEEVQEPAAGA